MYNEVIERLLKSLQSKFSSEDNYAKFSGAGYEANKIDKKNFHKVEKLNSDKKIAFIDGGNAEILGSPSFLLELIRTGYVIYKNGKKLASKKFDAFCLIDTINKDGDICYGASLFKAANPNGPRLDSIGLDAISFNSLDKTLMLGVNRAEISAVANAVRRFAELKLAKIVSEKRIADIIVLDGNLQSTITDEGKYLEGLYDSCIDNNVSLSALSKTTSLFTESGNLLSVVLSKKSGFPLWFYHPIAKINNPQHKAEMFFVKLHSKSKHIFRFEVFNAQLQNAEEIINILADYSNDGVFIGYPYGLVEADKIARITNQEKDYLSAIFLIKLKNRNIEEYLNSKNAHEILNRVSF